MSCLRYLCLLRILMSNMYCAVFFLFLEIFSYYKSYKKSLKIPKGGNQNPYIEQEQTTQWPKDTKGR